MEAENRQPNRDAVVPRQMKGVVEPRSVFLTVQFHEARMFCVVPVLVVHCK